MNKRTGPGLRQLIVDGVQIDPWTPQVWESVRDPFGVPNEEAFVELDKKLDELEKLINAYPRYNKLDNKPGADNCNDCSRDFYLEEMEKHQEECYSKTQYSKVFPRPY